MNPARPPRATASGFSLIESLVALVIISVSLPILFQIFSTGVRHSATAEQRMVAAIVADSKLAALSDELITESYADGGEARGGFRWRIETQPFVPDHGEVETPPENVVLYQVSVEVQWDDAGQTKTLEMKSLRALPGP